MGKKGRPGTSRPHMRGRPGPSQRARSVQAAGPFHSARGAPWWYRAGGAAGKRTELYGHRARPAGTGPKPLRLHRRHSQTSWKIGLCWLPRGLLHRQRGQSEKGARSLPRGARESASLHRASRIIIGEFPEIVQIGQKRFTSCSSKDVGLLQLRPSWPRPGNERSLGERGRACYAGSKEKPGQAARFPVAMRARLQVSSRPAPTGQPEATRPPLRRGWKGSAPFWAPASAAARTC